MTRARNKTCLDCLHCKVSAKSTANVRLCYCGMAKNVKNRKEFYWLVKKTCENFVDMGAYYE